MMEEQERADYGVAREETDIDRTLLRLDNTRMHDNEGFQAQNEQRAENKHFITTHVIDTIQSNKLVGGVGRMDHDGTLITDEVSSKSFLSFSKECYKGDSSPAKNRKRDHDEAFPSEGELSLMSKPERKRFREKRRRDRVNASFDELRSLLIRVDPQCSNRVEISQLELVDRSVFVINQLLEDIGRLNQMLRDVHNTRRERVNVSIPFVNPFENDSASPLASHQAVADDMPRFHQHGHNPLNTASSSDFHHQQQMDLLAQNQPSVSIIPHVGRSRGLSDFESHEPDFTVPPYSSTISNATTNNSNFHRDQPASSNGQHNLPF